MKQNNALAGWAFKTRGFPRQRESLNLLKASKERSLSLSPASPYACMVTALRHSFDVLPKIWESANCIRPLSRRARGCDMSPVPRNASRVSRSSCTRFWVFLKNTLPPFDSERSTSNPRASKDSRNGDALLPSSAKVQPSKRKKEETARWRPLA